MKTNTVNTDSPAAASELGLPTPTGSASFTPGPWIVNLGMVPILGQKCLGVIRDAHTEDEVEEAICIIARESICKLYDEANARLIAAAPDLFERLNGLMMRLETIRETDKSGLHLDDDIESARLVIDRAIHGQNAEVSHRDRERQPDADQPPNQP